MATTTSVSPTAVDRSGSRRAQAQSTPSRSQSTRTRAAAPAPSPGHANQTHHRTSSSRNRAVDEVVPQADYETPNVTEASRGSSSKDRSLPPRAEPGRSASGHQRSSSRYSSNMPTQAANGAGPAPVVTPSESKHKSSGKSRTTIPAQTGNWVLGKTIGAGSMGKVKLARRAEGGEQVCILSSKDVFHRQS
jgi:serine/threonine protein kinase KIN1/2